MGTYTFAGGDFLRNREAGGMSEAPQNYGVAVLESTTWPGAWTVAQKDKYCNFYCGNGLKAQRAFLPLRGELAPAPIMEEAVEKKELIQEPVDPEDLEGEGEDSEAEGDGG